MANKKLSAIISIGGAVAASLKNAIGQTQAGIGRIGEAVAKLEARQRELNNVIAQQGKLGASASALKVQYAQQELALIDKHIAKLKQQAAAEARIAAARQANSARRQEIGGAMRQTVTTGVVAALPLMAAMKQSVGYEYQLQLIGNTANMTKAEIGRLSDEIMASSKETNQSAVNTQKAIGFLIAAGMEIGTAREMMSIVGKTATATGGDVEDMAKAVFTLNDSLKIAPGDMMKAMDTLAVAGKEGNVELKDMAKVLPVLGSGFVALKMEGREAAATMGAALEIARKGAADADEAANNMKNFIAKIMSPETLKKAKKEFNLDLYKIITDAQKKGKNPFEASMEAIMKATKGDQKAIGELFSDMQVQNFLRPMIQNWDKYKEIKDKALKGGGTVDSDFAKVMATSKEQIDKVGGALQRLAIVGGGALSKAFGGKGGLAERIDAVTKWISVNEELVGTIAKVAVGFFGARLAVLGTMYVFNIARGAWLAGAAVLTRLPAILGLVATGLRMAGTAVLWLGRALLLNPIGLAVTAIGLAALVIYKNWEPIKAFFTNLWGTVKQIFDSAVAWIMDKVAVVFNIIDKVKAGIKGVMGGAATIGEKVKGGEIQYDAMGNVTGFTTAEELPQPAAAGSSKAAPVVTDNSQTTFNITQQPGQDPKAVADEVDRLLKRRAAVEGRSKMYDGANQ